MPAATVTLWGRACSLNVQKVLWALGELGLAHQHIPAGGRFGGLDTAEFRALNPHGKVPVLREGEVVVWESNAILRYLAARHGEGTLWATDPAERSQADRWIDWAAAGLQPTFLRLFWGHYRTPAPQRDERLLQTLRADCARHFEALDRQLAQHPFVAGADFSLADIVAGTPLHRYVHMGETTPLPAHVAAWQARLAQRPAYLAHVAVPFDELFGRLDY